MFCITVNHNNDDKSKKNFSKLQDNDLIKIKVQYFVCN